MHPIDGSVVEIRSWLELSADGGDDGPVVVHSLYDYRGPGVQQHISRHIEDGGRTYRVVNSMVVPPTAGEPAASIGSQVANIRYGRNDPPEPARQ